MSGRNVIVAIVLVAAVAALGVWAVFFRPHPQPVDQISAFLKAAHYVPLPLPDPALGPGAIVETKEESPGKARLLLLGSLQDCGVPLQDFVVPVTGPGLGISNETSQDYNASAALSVPGVEAGSGFDSAQKARFTVTGGRAERINVIALSAWVGDIENTEAFSKQCARWLDQERVFIVRDAFALDTGTIEVFDSAGTKLNVGKDVIKLSGSAKAQGSTALTFATKLYVGVQNMALLDGEFRTLGEDNPAATTSPSITEIVAVERGSWQ